jgi:hypothetical protein
MSVNPKRRCRARTPKPGGFRGIRVGASALWSARARAPLWMRSGTWLPILFLATAASPNLLACTACFGQSDSSMARGMNMGIFSLLLVITCVLTGVAGFFVYLMRRSAQLAEAHERTAAEISENRTHV